MNTLRQAYRRARSAPSSAIWISGWQDRQVRGHHNRHPRGGCQSLLPHQLQFEIPAETRISPTHPVAPSNANPFRSRCGAVERTKRRRGFRARHPRPKSVSAPGGPRGVILQARASAPRPGRAPPAPAPAGSYAPSCGHSRYPPPELVIAGKAGQRAVGLGDQEHGPGGDQAAATLRGSSGWI